MPSVTVVPGQIWQDNCYYLDTNTGECMRKYVLILAVHATSGDSVTMVFTTKPNGLTENPACYIGNPRSGYFLGVLGGVLSEPTWVDFSSIKTLDNYDLDQHIQSKRKSLLQQSLTNAQICAVLRCVMQCEDDISIRQYRWLGDAIASLGCR